MHSWPDRASLITDTYLALETPSSHLIRNHNVSHENHDIHLPGTDLKFSAVVLVCRTVNSCLICFLMNN